MNKKFNSEYRGLSKSEKIYDYSISIKKDRHYDYYEGRYID